VALKPFTLLWVMQFRAFEWARLHPTTVALCFCAALLAVVYLVTTDRSSVLRVCLAFIIGGMLGVACPFMVAFETPRADAQGVVLSIFVTPLSFAALATLLEVACELAFRLVRFFSNAQAD
jgi:hypothetical protein